jgi:hypothetical protein
MSIVDDIVTIYKGTKRERRELKLIYLEFIEVCGRVGIEMWSTRDRP